MTTPVAPETKEEPFCPSVLSLCQDSGTPDAHSLVPRVSVTEYEGNCCRTTSTHYFQHTVDECSKVALLIFLYFLILSSNPDACLGSIGAQPEETMLRTSTSLCSDHCPYPNMKVPFFPFLRICLSQKSLSTPVERPLEDQCH